MRRTEEQLRVSQKMEAVGRLAGGIAHDFNNLLGVVKCNSDLAMTELEAGSPVYEDLRQISVAADRAAALTRKLLTFSRKEIPRFEVLKMAEVIDGAEKMLRRLIGEDIVLHVNKDPHLECVVADDGQIEQVLMNLAINARDAMPDGGVLTIESKNVELEGPQAEQEFNVKPGSYIYLGVRDSGCGMSEDIQTKIFEPFYTTKEAGKGTGLGLSTVYGIVTQYGGGISVRSAPGEGSAFEIVLPRVEGRREMPTSSLPVERVVPGTETVVVVEDEDALRRLICRILTERGYTVIEACHGVEALEKCGEHPGVIHMLLSDVVMPKMGGLELSEHMVAQYPGIKILFMSGYADNNLSLHGLSLSDVALIEKPFSARELELRVREVLDDVE